MPDPLRPKALAVLRDGRITLLSVRCDLEHVVRAVIARVEGHNGVYRVELTQDGPWICTCRDGRAGRRCAHVLAAQLVTGHAARPAVACRLAS